MTYDNTCVVVYSNFQKLESALDALKNSHYDINKLSIIAKGVQQDSDAVGFYCVDGKTAFLGAQSKFWNELERTFSKNALFLIPNFGAIFIAGSVVSLFVTTSKGFSTVGGSGVLTATLYNLGIPANSIRQYEAELKANRFLLICHGKKNEVEQAHDILSITQTQDMSIHFI